MSDPLLTIDAGENLLLTLTVRDENGTAVDLAEVSEASFWLVYEKPHKVLKAWTFRGPSSVSVDMQTGDGTGELELELLPSETATPGTLRLISQVCFTDTTYFSSGHQADVVVTEDFMEISEVIEYGVPLVAADPITEDMDDSVVDDNGDNVADDNGDLLVA